MSATGAPPGWAGHLPAEVRETHVAVIFLMGDRAYKVKKPVDVGFLDFRTRARRLAACRREVELNRRLAPDVYLGVADVTGVDGALCDHMVVMRRMPDRLRLATLVREHPAPGDDQPLRDNVARLARLVATFHAGARHGVRIAAEGSRDAISARWEATFAQLDHLRSAALDGAVLAQVRELTRVFLAGRDALFQSRVDDGRIIDGHGDLIADDIFCLADGPRVLDCIEFDDRLRWLDGLDDIAFLAMDLERLGAPELGELLLDRYVEYSGDPAPQSLREHYLAYRAFVRTKVACLRYEQGDLGSAEQAGTHAEITLRHLRRGEVRLIVVGGLPGTGKSTLAGRLADELGAVLLSSDRVRKELAGVVPAEHRPAPYRAGLYADEHTDRTYRELLRRSAALLARGESVVLDASWTTQAHRESARALARETHSRFVPLCCRAPRELAAERLRTRSGSMSDADAAIAELMAAERDPWPDAVAVPTDCPLDATLGRALATVGDPADEPAGLSAARH
jgi:hypothetical protein